MNSTGKSCFMDEDERIKYLRDSLKQAIEDHGSDHEHTNFFRRELCQAVGLRVIK